MIKAVLFDMDGLMFDTEVLGREGWMEAGRIMGYNITEKEISKIRGTTSNISKVLFEQEFGPEFDYWKARSIRIAKVAELIEENGVPVKPGLYELLKDLRKDGIKTAVASSTRRALVASYLEKTGLTESYDAIIGGDDITHSKPDPEPFLKAAAAVGCDPKDCLVLEDSANGLRAGLAAGGHVICIPDLTRPGDELLAQVDAVYPSLHEVYDWIKEQNKGA